MMKQCRSFMAGVIVTLVLVALIGTVSAVSRQEQATLDYLGIKITLDGKEVVPTDANGNTVEPFAINGTTYLPVRGIASALGLGVDWDQATQTVILSSASANTSQSTQPSPTPTGTETLGQKNALEKAKQYLSIMAFSYSGLVEQLKYEGFSADEAAYGADHSGADWNEQAAKKAQQYIDLMSFSRQGLIDQLKHDGFTEAQAEYGVSAVGY